MEYYVYARGEGSSYTVDLQRHLRNVQKVDLLTVSVPRNTEYNITEGKNCITLNGTTQYSIPNGRYTGELLANVITTIMSPLIVTYRSETNVFIIGHTNQSFTLTFNTEEIQKRLGFSNATYTSVDHSTTLYKNFINGQIVFSDTGADLTTRDDVLMLDIEELRTDGMLCNDSDRTFGVIGQGFDTWTYTYGITYESSIPRVSRLTVQWLKSDGTPVNFNGQGYNSFLLRFTCRKSNEVEDENIEEDLTIKKIERMIQDAIPPPVEKSHGVPKFVYVLIILALCGILYWKFTGSQRTPAGSG
jgi:hypothetical protein